MQGVGVWDWIVVLAVVVVMGDEGEGVKNGDAMAEEEGPMVGPVVPAKQRHKRPLEFERAFLDALPSAQMYVEHAIPAVAFTE